MTTDRRTFLAGAAGLAAAASLPSFALADLLQPKRNLKLLILGGTGFLGPHVVQYAVQRGHEMTLFNRGKSGPEKFPDLEWLKGDRYSDFTSLEEQVAAGRKWDAVIDTFTYVPKTVTDAMDVLLPAMNQYVVVSTVSVYQDGMEPGADETWPLATMPDDVAEGIKTHREVGAYYGAMKARVENAAEARLPGKVTNIRPGLIVGPGDWTGRYTYWPVRASEGGRMIAPGDGTDYVQYIDARDLGPFVIRAIERQLFGAYNAISPAGERTCRDMVNSAIRVADAGTEPVWMDTPFLQSQGVRAWADLPVWIPNSSPTHAGAGLASTSKAMAAGLAIRSIDDTSRATLDDYRERIQRARAEQGDQVATQAAARLRGGLTPERETAVLEAWESKG
ncbi:MAG: NAD-dependent epimerase/dehydratase family protein [Planctomycetota bacterium]